MDATPKAGRKPNAKSLANLIPFKPGHTTPGPGAPKRKLIVELLEEELEARAKAEGLPKREAGKLVARAWLEQALNGSLGHMRELLDRRDGPVVAKVELSADVPKMLAGLWAGVLAEEEPRDVLPEDVPADAIGSPVGEASDARLLTQGQALDVTQGQAVQPSEPQPDPTVPDPS